MFFRGDYLNALISAQTVNGDLNGNLSDTIAAIHGFASAAQTDLTSAREIILIRDAAFVQLSIKH